MAIAPETVQIGLNGGMLVALIGVFVRNGRGRLKQDMAVLTALERVDEKLGQVVENTRGLSPCLDRLEEHLESHNEGVKDAIGQVKEMHFEMFRPTGKRL